MSQQQNIYIHTKTSLSSRLSIRPEKILTLYKGYKSMGTRSFPGVRCGRGVTLTPHSLLVPRSKIE